MVKKYFLTILFSIFLSCSLYAIDVDVPQCLKDLGYAATDLVDYKKVEDKEYFTMKNWQTADSPNTITFEIVEGKILNWQSP
ncbi:MAG: hypothetical protein WCY05_00810 [Candidatus Omnitrophota bacterium]